MLCAGSAALLIAPAAYHRVVYRRRLKQHLVRVANRLALSGLMMLLLAMISAIVLILDVVLGLGAALFLGTGALAWFVAWWFVLPLWSRLRHHSLIYATDVGMPYERSPGGRDGLMGPGRWPPGEQAADGASASEEPAALFAGPDSPGVNPMSNRGPIVPARRVTGE
jgi:hypothetical protein